MDLAAAQSVTILCMFAACFTSCIVPSVVHIHTEPHSRKRRILRALKRYCNCLSGGVFAGAFFTQFYPHVVKEFTELIPDAHSIWHHPLQLGPTVVFLGFLLTALLEKIVDIILRRLKKQQTRGDAVNQQEMNDVSVDGPFVHDDDPEDEDSVDTDPLSPATQLTRPASRKEAEAHNHSRSTSAASHGHHHPHHISLEEYQGATRFIVLLASLGTHSAFEGMALGLIKSVSLLFKLFFSILIHEFLMALALGISLSQQQMRLRTRLVFCLIFSITIPLGQVVGLLIQQTPETPVGTACNVVLKAIAAGTFLHVMFMEILPQELHGHFGVIEAMWVIVGYLLIPLTSLATGGDH
ncbi:zinc transporter ZIP3-like [Paramacrobiotus metropolitanus]|uniref:zinc transporter ZIP3-like n=1 Tax=Paramacrobiotus metropolitanus TaxID=2943436 RepID=UPI0024456FEE|nr:zinc transporter ZIP3-like [Paramacrobiotus metropolitanus]XP_055327742.1 zinc transporter ZIP3-like [Paramacrobiotus metropolitanus]XP_055327743.1 zinc transporter ZIP3-like [Paramacrobiotus metropolitanus]XP_055327744.1 zinc transporter ZIP3-like [Paramacrobiotus metropolitanus]XP_055327745.1 zinc transporter ZIP3-like [Paramacrobiotus metropolitanus]XP_055327746.1 zinc transporter ZIP3-like [Paramacrobiotus metropolitanus]XP_055327747.1 zinc transporter ZIP3-like [Paramacrobiotus metrop